MANIHAIAADAAAPEAPAPAEPEAAEPETDNELPEAELGSFDEGEPEAEPEPQGVEFDEDADYLVDGEVVKGKDLLGGRMMRDDYTRKTQALAEERKAAADQIESLEDERDDLIDWAKGLSNPARMESELEANFPEAFAQLKERIIEDALREAELAEKPEMLRYYREARKAKLEEEARKAEQEANQRVEGRKSKRAEVAKLRTDYAGWSKTAMEQAGLNPANADHREALTDRMIAAHKSEKWTAETFVKAAKHVGKLIGAKAPEPKAPEPEKPVLPPVRPIGQRPKPEARRQAEAAAKKAAAPKSFDELRAKYGAR